MDWIEICIDTSNEALEAISHMLVEMGAGGVVIDDPFEIRKSIKDSGSSGYFDKDMLGLNTNNIKVKAYFHENPGKYELEKMLKPKLHNISKYMDIGSGHISFSIINEEDWANNWKKYYKPFEICENIIIKPTWEEYENTNKIVINIDPGMAFGTGTHETTRLCSQIISRNDIRGLKIADIGCGSGILSIIAARLGAREVDAVDIDKTAVCISKENCKINNADSIVNLYTGTINELPGDKYDIIVANIIADTIIDIGARISRLLCESGSFIASGIIRDRKYEVMKAYKSLGLVCREQLEKGEWVAVRFVWQDSL